MKAVFVTQLSCHDQSEHQSMPFNSPHVFLCMSADFTSYCVPSHSPLLVLHPRVRVQEAETSIVPISAPVSLTPDYLQLRSVLACRPAGGLLEASCLVKAKGVAMHPTF